VAGSPCAFSSAGRLGQPQRRTTCALDPAHGNTPPFTIANSRSQFPAEDLRDVLVRAAARNETSREVQELDSAETFRRHRLPEEPARVHRFVVRADLERYLDESRVGAAHPESPLITTRSGHAFTGNGLYQVLKRLKASSGVPHLCPHALRHYWTEHFDGDLFELMRAGGWNSLTMVDRYRGHRPPQRARTSTLASALAATPDHRPKRRSPNQGDGRQVVRREAAQLAG